MMDGSFSSKFISGDLPVKFSGKYLSMMLHFTELIALEKNRNWGVGVSVRSRFFYLTDIQNASRRW